MKMLNVGATIGSPYQLLKNKDVKNVKVAVTNGRPLQILNIKNF